MKIVRKYLTPDEISNPNIRIPAPDEVAQVTPDGGETWIDAPGIDPRHGDALRLPPLTGDAQCDAAARMTAQWKDTLDAFVFTTDSAEAVQVLLTLVVALTGPVGVLVWIVWAIVNALVLIGRESIVSAFTSEVWDGIQCIIFCNIGTDGQMSAEQNADIMTEIAAQYPGTVYNTLVQLNYWYGEVLLSNAGVVRTETGDCDECACQWVYEWNFLESDGGFHVLPCESLLGTWTLGVGWQNTASNITEACLEGFTLPAGTMLTNVTMTLSEAPTTSGYYKVFGVNTGWDGSCSELNPQGAHTSAALYERVIPVTISFSGYSTFNVAWFISESFPIAIERLTITGTGDVPDFTGGEFI